MTATRLAVRGGGTRSLVLKAGDVVTVRDPAGQQAAHLLPPLAVGLEIPASALRMADGGVSLFEADSVPGSIMSFRAAEDCLCVLAAPGQATTPTGQVTLTDLEVTVEGRGRVDGWELEPLADVKCEILVRAATAQAYTVAAGDYIQILDVEGRQCSDFLAFAAEALAAGAEHGLDPTVTRTLHGMSSPIPGLHAKYFDDTMRPLVEIVQDSVGRHDTFLLACTAKYYADAGYPGHANCTENFNAALSAHGVSPRTGWPAINFFYNTSSQEDGSIVFDEPWSRPGDFVLLRALTDIVCASSSCADDIDPANGWMPTDIKVRIYDKDCVFSPGSATRMTADAEPRLTRKSAFHDRTSAMTKSYQDYKGFWTPTCYSDAGPIEEYWACRERAVVMDLSALRKFEVTGPDAERLMQLALTRDMSKLAVGQVVYSAMCYETGGMVDDGTVFRFGVNNFRWICGDDYCGVWLRQLADVHGLKVWVRSSTDQMHNLAVQGPLSREVLKGIVTTLPNLATLEDLKWFRFTIGRIGEAPIVVSRTGYTGELGYEVWCHPDDGPVVWDAIWAAGAPHQMRPLGLTALDMLRVEAGLIFAGYEFCDQTDPFEAGIGFAVPASKTDHYIGSDALALRRQAPQRKLIGLRSDTTEAIGHGDPIYAGRAQVGIVTSAIRSPKLGCTIALARVDIRHTGMGSELEIGKLDGHQKRIQATIVEFPHYDPSKTRVRQ